MMPTPRNTAHFRSSLRHLLKQHALLIVIFLVALLFRVWKLGVVPWGFHVDEVDAGYIGRYIFSHGRDVYGNILPFVFDKFGDFRPTGIFYLSGLSVLMLGATEFAVRLPSALAGAASVVALWWFVKKLTGNTVAAWGSACMLAITPWHIVLSRATSEGVVGLLAFMVGLGLWTYRFVGGSRRLQIAGIAFLFFSYLFYHPFRVLVPFVFLFFLFIGQKGRERRVVVFACVLSVILSGLLSLSSAGKSRLAQVVFWKNPEIPKTLGALAIIDGPNNVLMARSYHNKVVAYTREFITQYLLYYSPDFLFIRGGYPDRYVVPHQGVLPIVSLPFILLGMVGLIREKKVSWLQWFVLYLFLIAPLPAALTYEDAPNIHRAIVLLLPLAIFGGWGVGQFAHYLGKRPVLWRFAAGVGLMVLVTMEMFYFWHEYTVHSPAHKSFLRNDGVREMMDYVIQRKNQYDRILIPVDNEHAVYYAFYTRAFRSVAPGTFQWRLITDKIDTIEFVPDKCPSMVYHEEIGKGKSLMMVDQTDCYNESLSVYTKIPRKDGTEAYKIREFPAISP